MKKRSKLQKFMPYVMGACLLTFVAACGSDDDDDSSSGTGGGGGGPQQEQQPNEGRYRVTFLPLNTNITDNNTTGTGEVTIQGDEVIVRMDVAGALPAEHSQHIHTGRACATVANDTNRDGFVDSSEASNVSGDIIIPLDSDLSSQDAGSNAYPSGSTYVYNEETTLTRMLADLQQAPDTNPDDHIVKLPAGEDLNLAGRVIEIHGVPNSVVLPETVQSDVTGQSAHESLPIACGVIERIDGGTTGATGGTGGTTGATGGTGGTTGTTGGTTGGDTGGTTGGETGGDTGGDTGGETGGETGGDTGGIVR